MIVTVETAAVSNEAVTVGDDGRGAGGPSPVFLVTVYNLFIIYIITLFRTAPSH